MAPGARAYVTVTVPNTGTTTWMAGLTTYPYLIGSKNPENNSTWGLNRVALGSNVYPSGQASFGFWITAPSTPGTYSFSWEMVRENMHWFGEIASTTITVAPPPPVDDAQLVSATVASQMTEGDYYNVSMTFKNTGNTTWTQPNFLLANPDDNLTFGLKRVAMSTASVAPGQSTTFSFQVRAPAAGTYAFQWGMVWEFQHRFGQTSTTYVTVKPRPTTPAPTISPSHTAMVAGQSFTMSWSTTNATSLSHVCSASGTGYTVNEALAVSGSRSMTAQAAWVSYPSTCSWTATGPGGTTTVSETLSTTAAPTAKPTISVSRSSQVAGQSFTTSWSTTNATSLTHVCTASGTGYTVNEALAVSGSRALTAQSGWVGYPSSCTWTASGAGGSATYTETMTTVAAVNSSVTYIYTDGLGSPVARTDASGHVISQTRYEPYGYVASGVQPTIGFTGHVNDVDTGLTYMQQRYYDPVAGRFLSIDPILTDVNTGNGFNRYVYADNSPYGYIDPDGRGVESVTVDRNNNVHIVMGIAYVGAISPGRATTINAAIADAWSGKKGIYNVTLKIIPGSQAKFPNLVTVVEGLHGSKTGGNGASMTTLYTKDPAGATMEEVMTHEVMHEMGVNSETISGDRYFATGEAQPSWEGNIAAKAAGGKVDERNIKEVVTFRRAYLDGGSGSKGGEKSFKEKWDDFWFNK
jgi:RHS repeat-associated protein